MTKAAAKKSPLTPNVKQAATRLKKIQKSTIAMRKQLWPNISDDMLWIRHGKKGFTTIPRAMPLFIEIIDAASKQVLSSGKSAPAGRAYLVLWCRVFDEGMVKIDADAVTAMEAGYTGERNVTTWRQHLNVLKDLGFIDFKEGPAGPCQYVLILNPYHAANKLREKGWLQEGLYNALFQRAIDIGATDLAGDADDEDDDEDDDE